MEILSSLCFTDASFALFQCKEKMRPVKRALKMLESPEGTMAEKDQVSQTRQVDYYFLFNGALAKQRYIECSSYFFFGDEQI